LIIRIIMPLLEESEKNSNKENEVKNENEKADV
jgi:hypothetical protein